MSFLDHARYASTPALVPEISKMYFMSLAPSCFTLRFGLHRVVGATCPVLDILPQIFSTTRNWRANVDLKPVATTYVWRRKDDYRTRGSGRQPGLGGGLLPARTVHGNPMRENKKPYLQWPLPADARARR
jgi:hypothetical protein